MSIVKTRSFLERSGCGWITSIIIGIVFIVGIIAYGGGGGGRTSEDPQTWTVFEMGDFEVSRAVIEALGTTEDQRENLPVEQATDRMQGNLRALVRSGYALAAAEKLGISIDEDTVKQGMQSEQDQMLELYAASGTEKKSVEEFKKSQQGQQLIAWLSGHYGKFEKIPGGSDYLRAYFAQSALAEYFKKQIKATDDEVKHGSDQLMFRAINIFSSGGGDADLQKNVEVVEADIKKDGFLKTAEKYGKKPAVNPNVMAPAEPTPMVRSMVLSTPETADLVKLKPGETSKVIDTPQGGKAIFYLLSIKEDVPKDFETKKAEYRRTYIDALARGAVETAIEEQKKTSKIEFKDKGYEAVYALTTLQPSFDNYVAIYKQAMAAEKVPGSDLRAAIYARYTAMQYAWMMATPKDKKHLAQERADTLEKVLEFREEFSMRLDLADLYIDEGKGPEAMAVLDVGASTAQKAEDFVQLEVRAKKLLAEKLITEKDIESLTAAKEEWLKVQAEQAKMDAEFAKKEAAAKKEAEEQARQFDEEKKKIEAEKAAKAKAGGANSTPAPANGK